MKNEMELYKSLMRATFGRDCVFDIEECGEVLWCDTDSINLYNSLYGKTMSLLESTVDKDKLEATKTIAKQLFTESYFKFEEQAFKYANNYYNQKSNKLK